MILLNLLFVNYQVLYPILIFCGFLPLINCNFFFKFYNLWNNQNMLCIRYTFILINLACGSFPLSPHIGFINFPDRFFLLSNLIYLRIKIESNKVIKVWPFFENWTRRTKKLRLKKTRAKKIASGFRFISVGTNFTHRFL